MTADNTSNKIEFVPFALEDRSLYQRLLSAEGERGCEFSFANLYLWDHQGFAYRHDHVILFSQYDRRSVYLWPVGQGDKKAVVDAIIADAAARGIPCRITGLSEEAKATLEALHPGQFLFHPDEASYDYVYDIHDLADLQGQKYHGKRNHLNRFHEAYPHCRVHHLGKEAVAHAREMAKEWYAMRLRENPDADFLLEEAAIEKALRDYRELEMEGLVLESGGEVLGFTLASRLSEDTFDVHFEKARPDVQGAYAAVNCALTRYLRNKYPEVRFIDREEDMGLEGLRRAKRSYHPHHMIKKYWACLREDGYDH